jgi:sporulation related protein
MAENDQRSYRDPRRRNAEEAPGAQADDPLAELARLIGQRVPMDRVGRDRRSAPPERADDRRSETGRSGGYGEPDEAFREPARRDEQYSASDDAQYEQDLDPDYRAGRDERYEQTGQSDPAPLPRASRFRQQPDLAAQPRHDAEDGGDDGRAYGEAADWRDRSSDDAAPHYANPHYADEYEDEGHVDEGYAYADEYGDDQSPRRRSGFVFVGAVFALAVLGTAGAFAYRAVFGGAVLPALPPIIKAEGGPNKIMPSTASSQADTAGDADATNPSARERLVSREERPVDIPPPAASTAPRPVSTVPVFPDPPPMGGPGAVVGYSASLPASSSAASTEPPAPSGSAMTTATAPHPTASTAVASPPSASLSGPAPTSGTPTAPAPKKIRTVTIHADQATADGPASSSAASAAAPRSATPSQSSNGPLSIVPSSNDAPAPAARPRAAAPQPVPLSKSPANETASAAPAAPATTTSGGYAVQVSSQRSEEEAQSSFRDLQAKYPDVLGGRAPIIRRADLGAKGIFFRAMVGPFGSADQAAELCSNLKAAGGSCLVQKN